MLTPTNSFERWRGIRGVNFRASCYMNAFILNSIYFGLVTWITSTATTTLDKVIVLEEYKNKAARDAALWASTLGVAFVTAFGIYMLLHLIFGYGGALFVGPPFEHHHLKAIDHLMTYHKHLFKKKR